MTYGYVSPELNTI